MSCNSELTRRHAKPFAQRGKLDSSIRPGPATPHIMQYSLK